jgi:hypothetical protein
VAEHRALANAVAHGPDAFVVSDTYKDARERLDALYEQLAHIEVVCAAKSAQVTLNGTLLFAGPGEYVGPVMPGEHTVTASRSGYVADKKQVELAAGSHTRLLLAPLPPDEWLDRERPLPWWLPWLVMLAGALAAGAGRAVQQRAAARARGRRTLVLGLYVAGGVVVAAGLVMALMNRPDKELPAVGAVLGVRVALPVPKGCATN